MNIAFYLVHVHVHVYSDQKGTLEYFERVRPTHVCTLQLYAIKNI